ncbi:uncharacterized protein LOC127288594 [Leptopilina boulardi]|uniref:uncharacterized protein LOC127288594 n=1 Tax=Leptopilina boulardi TaxID=63433 RepID=UPI0021F618BF|nr:uncharacterized protein LOC127288594 [Leptopilina boulardi]
MDKNSSTTPKTTPKNKFKIKRIGVTPDSDKKSNLNSVAGARFISRHKSTTSLHDLSLNVTSASALKRKIGSTRQSLAPTSLVNSFGLKKIEPDNADTETGLLYDDYLRTLMADVLVKKKAKENEKKILNQLASLSKEQDLGDEKLMKMKSREKDINYLSALQNYLDTLVTQIRSECEVLNDSSVKDDLDNLRLQLSPFDFLRCQGIDLPLTPAEQCKFEETLNQCYKTIKEVCDLMKDKGDNLEKVKFELEESIDIQRKIESLQKNLHSSMNNLQISVMKSSSQSFAENMP